MKHKSLTMSVDKFLKIQDNPIQRDTEEHAKKAQKNHLKTPHPKHREVAIAKLRGGNTQWVLDGHTRRFLWNSGELKPVPKTLEVDIYLVDSKEEAAALYRCFDNSSAAETKKEQVLGALKYLGFKNINFHVARKLNIHSAINTIDRAMERLKYQPRIIDLFTPYKKEIGMLLKQDWNVSRGKEGIKPGLPSCTICAYLILVKLYGNDASGFWDGFYSGEGRPLRSGTDGSEAAAKWVINARNNGKIMGQANVPIGVMAILNAYTYYRTKKRVNRITDLYKTNPKLSTIVQLGKLLKELGYS